MAGSHPFDDGLDRDPVEVAQEMALPVVAQAERQDAAAGLEFRIGHGDDCAADAGHCNQGRQRDLSAGERTLVRRDDPEIVERSNRDAIDRSVASGWPGREQHQFPRCRVSQRGRGAQPGRRLIEMDSESPDVQGA